MITVVDGSENNKAFSATQTPNISRTITFATGEALVLGII